MSRALHVIGAVLVWTVVLAACAVGLAVCGPLLLVTGAVRGVWVVGRILAGRGEDVPDVATPALARRIDGADLGDVLARRRMGCGCRRTPDGPTAHCVGCGWVTCVDHAGATHLCEATRLYDWAHEWPLNRIKPADLDTSAAEPNELLDEIYSYLESQQ